MRMAIAILLAVMLSACVSHPLEAPPSPAAVSEVPDDWSQTQIQRVQDKADYLQQHWVAYDWFGNFAFSEADGIPFLVLKLVPKLAPELWGSNENFLDAVGLFIDERQKTYPVARGVGFSGLSRSAAQDDIDYASFTCGACHIGRVRLEDGGVGYLDGGVNTTFDIVQFRVKLYQTLQKAYAGEHGDKRFELLTQKLLQALDEVHQQNPHYFYNNFQSAARHFDAAYEVAQVDLFKKNAARVIKQFAQRTEAEYQGLGALVAKNYTGFETEMIAGLPGMADATGLSAINGYISLQANPLLKWLAKFSLPPEPGITDFMSVWEQDKRRASWDGRHQRLVNGGGQWNGNVPIPVYRNLIAMLTLGLAQTDVRVAAFADELLNGLPADPYPFPVDIELAKRGQKLFAEHCADCHQPKNGKVYDLGTSMKRAYVVGALLNYAARKELYDNCSPETTINLQGKVVKPCAEFDGVSLVGKKDMLMSPNNEHHGYNARPLSGIWAQAPYLHNGTVPTVYHLLVPDERPEIFIKSRLDYDQKLLGFAWDPQYTTNSGEEGYRFKVNTIEALSNRGHDKDITEGNKTYRLNWSADKPSAWAIIEYLKTL